MKKLRVCLCVVGFFLLTASLSNAQEKIRTVEKGQHYPNSPIEIVGLALGDKPFIDDARVLGDQDWLKHLTLSIKTVSNKNIKAFDISFLVNKQGKQLMGIPLIFAPLRSLFPITLPVRSKEK